MINFILVSDSLSFFSFFLVVLQSNKEKEKGKA